jgi:hypothetical protein
MKRLMNALPLLPFLFFIVGACSKDCDAPIDLSNTTWEDTAVINGIRYDPFKLQLNSNGSAVITIGGFSPFNGSWSKTPNSNVVYFFFDESATNKWKGEGTLNAANTEITGTVTRTAPSVLNGTFRVIKQ